MFILILYLSTLLNSLIHCSSFYVEYIELYHRQSSNKNSLTYFFPIWMSFMSFSCFIVLTRICSKWWIEMIRMDIVALIQTYGEKQFSFLPLIMILPVVFFIAVFIILKRFPFILSIMRILLIRKRCYILSNVFSLSIEIILFFN